VSDSSKASPNARVAATVVQYGPLLKTLWGQGVPYNDKVTKTGCSNYSNGRAPTGCVATAIAQVARYHAYPSTKYKWSIMPNRLWASDKGSNGANEVAKLMKDIGDWVGMDYGC